MPERFCAPSATGRQHAMPNEELPEKREDKVPESEIRAREAFERAKEDADGQPHWRLTLYTTWTAQLCAMMAFSFVLPFIPFYVRELGVNGKALYLWSGALVTGCGLMMAAVAPLWGWVADRYGRKSMVQRAMFGAGIFLSAMSRVTNVRQLLALRMLQGGFTGTVSASVALVSTVLPANRLAFGLGLMQAAVSAGASLGPLFGGMMSERWGSRSSFLVTGALLFAGGLLVQFGARERFHRVPPRERRCPHLRTLPPPLPHVSYLVARVFAHKPQPLPAQRDLPTLCGASAWEPRGSKSRGRDADLSRGPGGSILRSLCRSPR